MQKEKVRKILLELLQSNILVHEIYSLEIFITNLLMIMIKRINRNSVISDQNYSIKQQILV